MLSAGGKPVPVLIPRLSLQPPMVQPKAPPPPPPPSPQRRDFFQRAAAPALALPCARAAWEFYRRALPETAFSAPAAEPLVIFVDPQGRAAPVRYDEYGPS